MLKAGAGSAMLIPWAAGITTLHLIQQKIGGY